MKINRHIDEWCSSIGFFFLGVLSPFFIIPLFLYVLYMDYQSYCKRLNSDSQSIWGQCISFIRNNAIIVSLVLIYVFTYNFWENWIEKHIVDTIFQGFESNLLYDFIFIVVAVSCFIELFYSYYLAFVDDKKMKKINRQTIAFSIIAIVFWVYYRFCSHRFDLVSLLICKSIKYCDIWFIFAICKLMSFCFWKYYYENLSSISFPEKEGFARDLPISDKKEDALGRDVYVESAVSQLLKTDTNRGSFTCGINAPWGSGKTSFINLMKNQLKLDSKTKIIIDFNPWLYATEKDLVTAFFDELSKSLKKYDRHVAKKLIDYSKLLSAFETTETKMISSLLELTQHDDSSLQKKKQQISEAIRSIGKMIIVFIDDLDRLNADEIMEMMKLIRNVSDFPYMYILAAYDKSYIVKCLSSKMKSAAINYIEKIFEHEYMLAPCSNKSLRLALVDELGSIKSIKSSLVNYIKTHDSLNALSNLREVYRLSNRICSNYNLTMDWRVNQIDLLLFELFKTKYPVAFSLFEHKWHEVLEQDTNKQRYVLFKKLKKNRGGHFDFIDYLNRHKVEMCLNEFDIETIKMILSELFLQDRNEDDDCRINDIKWFNRYLNLTQLNTDITVKEFESTMLLQLAYIKGRFDNWSVDKSVSLKYRLVNYDKDEKLSREQLEKNIQGLFYAAIKNHWRIYDELTIIISHLKRFNNGFYSGIDRTFIKDELMGSVYSDFLSGYVGYLSKDNKYEDSPLNADGDNKVKDLIEAQQKIFSNCWTHYYQTEKFDMHMILDCFARLLGGDGVHSLCRNDILNGHNELYKESLFTAMKKHSETCIEDFLRQIIYREIILANNFKYTVYLIYPFVEKLWNSWNEFNNFLSKQKESDLIKEFKQFFEEYKRNKYQGIHFVFKIIEL